VVGGWVGGEWWAAAGHVMYGVCALTVRGGWWGVVGGWWVGGGCVHFPYV